MSRLFRIFLSNLSHSLYFFLTQQRWGRRFLGGEYWLIKVNKPEMFNLTNGIFWTDISANITNRDFHDGMETNIQREIWRGWLSGGGGAVSLEYCTHATGLAQ